LPRHFIIRCILLIYFFMPTEGANSDGEMNETAICTRDSSAAPIGLSSLAGDLLHLAIHWPPGRRFHVSV
jgi:hypothetical protein